MRLLAWLAILVTLGFGLRPFNFYSRNDAAFDPETSSLIFHGQSEQRYYWQRGIAYTNEPFYGCAPAYAGPLACGAGDNT